MNCITCHNPHHSVQKESPNFFNDKCLSCHDDCKDEFRENDNCIVASHMPSSSTIDIPHEAYMIIKLVFIILRIQ